MNLSLSFTVTPGDMLQIAIGSGRWNTAVVCAVPVVGDVILVASGSYTPFFTLSAGAFLGFLCLAVAIWRPRVGVRVDDNGVSTSSAEPPDSEKHRQYMYVPWASFATSGSATESAGHFWLKSGHGPVWIPKRAFPSENELIAFRQLVATKLGGRCKFAISQTPQ